MREQMIEEVVVDTVFMLFKTGCVNFCFFRGGVLIMSVIFFFFFDDYGDDDEIQQEKKDYVGYTYI